MQASSASGSGVPETIGPFRVLRLLGEGGMGAVYLGERMEQFSQQVAIKILHPYLFPATADAKIQKEGSLLASLEHPGIVRLLDLGVAGNGLRYMVMEYVDGVPITTWCDHHRLPLRGRIQILLELFEAVEYAHRHLVVHADLKPENILVTTEGKPRLLDFGVATVLSEMGASAALQDSGQGNHTPLYASPEQRLGERVNVTTDVYSLGLVAQSVLTGILPKPLSIGAIQATPADLSLAMTAKKLRALSSEPLNEIAAARATTPAHFIAAIEGDLEAILAKSLCIDPAQRFQSVQQLHDEFERHLFGYPILTCPASPLTRAIKWVGRNRLAAALGCVLLLVVSFSIIGVVRQAAEAARKRQAAQTRLHELVRLTDLLAGELYESLHGLQGSESAQTALLRSAHQTIDKLAADENRDPQLELELAQEYEKLARLELSSTPVTAEAVQQSTVDLDRERTILDRIDAHDPEAASLRARLPQMLQLRNAAIQHQPH